MNTLIFKHPERVLYEGFEMPVTQVQKAIRKHKLGKVPGFSVSFGPDRNQKIVVFEPEELRHSTTILYFHGGGYLVGTPESMDIGAAFFTERGYRFISIGYRLMPRFQFPAQVEDAYLGFAAAMDYLRSKAPDSKEFIAPPLVVGGNSAGGQLAAILGYNRADYFAPVQGVISLAGVMDQDDMLPRAGHRWSPHHIVSTQGLADDPPRFLAIHGTHDVLSPYSSEERFVSLLNRTAGRQIADLVPLQDWKAQHIYLTAGVFTRENAVIAMMLKWLEENFD